jgi:hypothetical protein
MPEFLSDEWLEALDRAACASPELRALGETGRLRVQLVVRDVPAGGDVCYQLVLGEGGARVVPGAAERPDLVVTSGYATAVELARGATNAQHALAAGQLRIGGDVESLASRALLLATVADVFAAVRAETTFPS